MTKAANLRYSLLFLGLPILWVSSFAFTGHSDSSTQQTFEFEFLPVALHASNAADYSADESNEKFAPVDEDIIIDVQIDWGLNPVTVNVEVVSPGDANHTTDDEQEEPHRISPAPQSVQGSVQEDPGQSGEDHGQGGEDPGQSGEDHGPDGDGSDDKDKDNKDKEKNDGNKDKDEDNPGNSGEDNGNKDKDEDNPGNSGEDNGNKDKDVDSPGQSGEDNGNKDKDKDSQGKSGDEHGNGQEKDKEN